MYPLAPAAACCLLLHTPLPPAAARCSHFLPLQLKIAYRVYTRNGDKEDAKGRYRGCPAEFDEWIPMTSMNKYRFGKLNTRVKDPVEEPVDDASDPPFVASSSPPPRFTEAAAAVTVRAQRQGWLLNLNLNVNVL